jgi:hypothetical protein
MSLELKMVYATIRRQVSNFHCEISRCDIELIQLLTDNILIPLLKGD